MPKPAWYGGNKIPDSYLRKFQTSVEDEGVPYEMRLFLDTLGDDKSNRRQSIAEDAIRRYKGL